MIEFENLKKLNSKFEHQLLEEFETFLNEGNYILGNSVINFESNFARFIGSNYGVGVGSGYDAIFIGLKALRLPPATKIILPANSYIATILAVVNAGFIPVLVEPNEDTSNFDISNLSDEIIETAGAVLVTHMYGNPCEMDIIVKFCEEHNLVLLEDCSHAHGAEFKGQKVGSFGVMSFFSFYPTKILGALGDAGAIMCNNENLYKTLLAFRNYGSYKKNINELKGVNSRMDEIQARFLNVKLNELNSIITRKNEIANIYKEELKACNLQIQELREGSKHVFYVFNIRTKLRNKLQEYLKNHNVMTAIHYPIPPYLQDSVKEFFHNEKFDITDSIHESNLSLPCSIIHSNEDILFICQKIKDFFQLY